MILLRVRYQSGLGGTRTRTVGTAYCTRRCRLCEIEYEYSYGYPGTPSFIRREGHLRVEKMNSAVIWLAAQIYWSRTAYNI
eukprot:scaffold87606_cov16-Prasinocladus_malaysianus.AAC.1